MDNYIGEKIKYFRVQQGLSQEKLALKAGVNPAFLGHLERGLKSPTMTTLDKIIEALNVSYSQFFDDTITTNDADTRQFYLNMISSCAKRLSDDKLKIVADIVLKLVELSK